MRRQIDANPDAFKSQIESQEAQKEESPEKEAVQPNTDDLQE